MKIYKIRRKTLETDVELKINFNGYGFYKIKTFNFFFDHIISQFVNYSLIDSYLYCIADAKTEVHHLIEDTAIIFAKTINLIKKKRYNFFSICMDDSHIIIMIDFCNRIFYKDNLFANDYDIQLLKEFLITLVKNVKCNMYVYIINSYNKHHLIENVFKLLGLLFKKLQTINYNSTKGII